MAKNCQRGTYQEPLVTLNKPLNLKTIERSAPFHAWGIFDAEIENKIFLSYGSIYLGPF